MTEQTWGYSGLVGEWRGTTSIERAPEESQAAAVQRLVGQVGEILGEMHRPRLMTLSWAEYDAEGVEGVFHDLEEIEVASWDAVAAKLEPGQHGGGMSAFSAVFIELDTAVAEGVDVRWAESSAELQISVPQPERTAEIASVSYRTLIDVWLPRTYGPDGSAHLNVGPAQQNRHRIERVLRGLKDLVGDSLRVGASDYYFDEISETGFRDEGGRAASTAG